MINTSVANFCDYFSSIDIFLRACQAASNLPALRVKRKKKWISWTYENYYQDIMTAAKAFIALGALNIHKFRFHLEKCPIIIGILRTSRNPITTVPIFFALNC